MPSKSSAWAAAPSSGRAESGRTGNVMTGDRYLEHGGELELELTAEAVTGIFEAALQAFAELVRPESEGAGEGVAARHQIELTGSDRAGMLVDWLNELVYLSEVEQFVPGRVEALQVSDDRVRATIVGRRAHPRQLVKAVTLNHLRLEQKRGIWHGRVVLDV